MGVLDEAIREHLELKRRQGASDEEIAQHEAEALGPARRAAPTVPAAPDAAADADVEQVEAELEHSKPEVEPDAEAETGA